MWRTSRDISTDGKISRKSRKIKEENWTTIEIKFGRASFDDSRIQSASTELIFI